MTVRHFLNAITKAGMCWRNYLIIRQMNNWPTALRTENFATSPAKFWQFSRKSSIVMALLVTRARVREIRKVYLFTRQYIYIVEGLKSDLSWAWKSGRNPSPISEIIRNKLPSEKRVMGWSTTLFSCFLKKLNKMMPAVATSPITSFWWVSLSLVSLTREKKTPTMMTERRLHDLAMTTAGNEAQTTA